MNGAKYKVNDNVFTGDMGIRINGSIVIAELDRDTKEHITGFSGKTKAYRTNNAGRVYLEDSQVTKCE